MNRIAIASIFCIALSTPIPAAAQSKTVFKLGNVQAPGMVVQTGLKRYADLVRERTKGEIEIEVYPASQLGSEQEILEGVALDTIHMFEGSAALLGRFLPKIDANDPPVEFHGRSFCALEFDGDMRRID